jgi:hypothetical protein
MSREAERWNIDLGVENRRFRKATRAGQPKEGSRMRLSEDSQQETRGYAKPRRRMLTVKVMTIRLVGRTFEKESRTRTMPGTELGFNRTECASLLFGRHVAEAPVRAEPEVFRQFQHW